AQRAVSAVASRARNRTGHQTAVIPPVEAEPGAGLPSLVLHVGCLIEFLVVVDAKNSAGGRGSSTSSADLRSEEPRRHAGEDHQRREAMEVGHAHPARISRNLGAIPFNWESDRRCAQNAEVIGVVGVLPDVLAGK